MQPCKLQVHKRQERPFTDGRPCFNRTKWYGYKTLIDNSILPKGAERVPARTNTDGSRYQGWSPKLPPLWKRSRREAAHGNAPLTLREQERWRDAVKLLLRRMHESGEAPIQDRELRRWAGVE